VPADAQAYMLTTGANLHALYQWVEQFLRDEIPEALPQLEKFEQAQQQWGVHLDRDILQAFSGECVTLALPAAPHSTVGGLDKVIALRCHKPDRIRELIAQGVERLAQTPVAHSQQLRLAPSQDVAGFDELSAGILPLFGVRPVIGFHDGWMIVATNPSAAQKVLQTLAGEAPSINTADHFRRFGLDVQGPVSAMSYTDLAASTRQVAQVIRTVGVAAPVMVGIAGAHAKPEDLKPLQEALGLLPSIANVVDKIDYLDASLTVVQRGDVAGSYVKRTVVLVRPPNQKPEEEPTPTVATLPVK
jgi:hypothetical protein